MEARKMLASSLCLTACLLATNVSQAYALNETTFSAVQNNIELYMEYINDADCTFSISNGTATIHAWVRGQSGNSTKCQIVINLQERSGSTWKTVQTWSETQNGRKATVNASKKRYIWKELSGNCYCDRLEWLKVRKQIIDL